MGDDLIPPEAPEVPQRPPFHLRIERENRYGQTVLSVDGSGFTPQEAFDDAMAFLRGAFEAGTQ